MASEKMIVNVDKLEGNSKKVRLDNRENDEAVAGAKSSQEAESDNLQSSGKDGGAFEQINNNKGNRQVKNNRNRQVKNVAIVMTEDASITLSNSIPESIQTLNHTMESSVSPLVQYPPQVCEWLGNRKAFEQTTTGKEQNVPEQQRTGKHGKEDRSNDSHNEKQDECDSDSNNGSYNIFANDNSSSDLEVTDVDEDITDRSPLPIESPVDNDTTGENIDESAVNKPTTNENFLRIEQETQCSTIGKKTSVKLKLKNAEDIIHSIEKKQGKSKLSRKPGRPKKVKPTNEGFETLKLKSKLLSRKPGRPKKVKPTNEGFETMKRKRSKLSIAQKPRGSKELNLTAWNTLLKMAIKKLKNMKQASNVKRIGGVVRRSQPTLKDISDDVVEKKLDDAAKRGVIDRIEKQGKVTYRIAIRNSDPEVLDQVKKTKVRRHTDGIAAKIPYAVRRLQDWNNKGRMENRNPNIQTEGDEDLLVGSLRRPDNPEQNTQTPPYNSNSVEDQPLNEYGSPGTSETTPNIGQRSPDVNNGNPEQSLARPARNLLEKAVESHPNATQPPGTCKSPANCQLQGRQHGVNFSHLARHGITVTPIRNRNSASNDSGSEEVAGGIHRFQRNQPVICRDDRAIIGQQRNLSVKIIGGDMKVSNGGVTVEMKCTELEIDGPPDDVLKLVTKFKPSFGALQ